MQWVRDIPPNRAGSAAGRGNEGDISVLLVAGDVASDLDTLMECLLAFQSKFDEVVFVPGNHELWCQRGGGRKTAPDSMVKLEDVLHVCQQCRVHTKPLIIQLSRAVGNAEGSRQDPDSDPRLIILPFLSWYHSTFDTDPDLPPETLAEVAIPGMRPFEQRWADFRKCSWPESVAPRDSAWKSLASSSQHIAEAFASINEQSWLPEIAGMKRRAMSTKRVFMEGVVVRRSMTNLARRIIMIEPGYGKDNHSLLVLRHLGCLPV
jgi:hypothetical protein